MKILMQKILNAESLSRDESCALFSGLHEQSIERQAAILSALRVKKESTEEILGAMDCFRKNAKTFESQLDAIDIVGTGGDGLYTFNISTAASLLVASCGVYVAKHGGRAVSSLTGSMDVVTALGIQTSRSAESAIENLAQHHYAYLCALDFNGGFKVFATLRKALGFPTIFNILGPLLHPMQPKRLVIGVYRHDLLKSVAQVLCIQGVEHALVVHSADGLDELSVSAPTHVVEVKEGSISEYVIDATEYGMSQAHLQDVRGGDAFENARIIRGVLSGAIVGPQADIVVLNAAAGLYVAGRVITLADGVTLAKQSIASGQVIIER